MSKEKKSFCEVVFQTYFQLYLKNLIIIFFFAFTPCIQDSMGQVIIWLNDPDPAFC